MNPRLVVCWNCNGTGRRPVWSEFVTECWVCLGYGEIDPEVDGEDQ